MEKKRKPTFDLEALRRDLGSVKALRMTRSARCTVFGLGLALLEVVEVVQSMRRGHFYKSMTSYADPHRWQDVYRVPWGGRVLYVKLTVDEVGGLILSMKEL